jgi:hypothetical protein
MRIKRKSARLCVNPIHLRSQVSAHPLNAHVIPNKKGI